MSDAGSWKTEEYHSHDMHVSTRRRAAGADDLPGHGDEWDFTVKVTPRGAGPDAALAEVGRSDPDVFYSTQAIAENMGFLKGREMIEGRAADGHSETGQGSRSL